MVAKKFHTFEAEVNQYHRTFRNAVRIQCPTLAMVKSLQLDDSFWDIGELTHPSEPWATDPDTKVGIQAFLVARNCEEELKRIAREVRQMIQSSLNMASKMDSVYRLTTLCKFLFSGSKEQK